MKPRAPALLALCAFLAPGIAAHAAGPGILLLPVRAGGAAAEGRLASYAEAYEAALAREFLAAGFDLSRSEASDDGATDPDGSTEAEDNARLIAGAASAAREAGEDYACAARLGFDGVSALASCFVVSAANGDILAADAFAFYLGQASLPVLDASAARLAASASLRSRAARGAGKDGAAAEALPGRVSIASPDEAALAELSLVGGGETLASGRIEGGLLEFDYLPLLEGSRVALRLSAPGRLPLELTRRVRADGEALVMPALIAESRHAFSLGFEPRRPLGLSAEFRDFIEPDWSFVYLRERLGLGWDFGPGGVPPIRSETSLGAGAYLLAGPYRPIRMGCVTGMTVALSALPGVESGPLLFADLLLEPEFFLEYRLNPSLSLSLALRGHWVLGGDLLVEGWQRTLFVAGGLTWRR